MKRIGALVWMVILILVCVGASASEAELHLPWGLTFGCDVDTFCEIAKENAGLEFVAVTQSSLVSSNDIEWFGYPSGIHASFSEIDGLNSLVVGFEEIEETTDKAFERGISRLKAVYDGLTSEYGEMTASNFSVQKANSPDGYSQHTFPLADNALDCDLIRLAAIENAFTTVSAQWGNAILFFAVSTPEEGYKTIKMSIQSSGRIAPNAGTMAEYTDYSPSK